MEPDALEEVHLRDRNRFALKTDYQAVLADAVRYKNRLKDFLDAYIPGLSGLSNRLVGKRKLRSVLEKLLNLPWVQTMGKKRFHRYLGRRDGDLKEGDIDRIYDVCMGALALHDEVYVDCDVLQGQVG